MPACQHSFPQSQTELLSARPLSCPKQLMTYAQAKTLHANDGGLDCASVRTVGFHLPIFSHNSRVRMTDLDYEMELARHSTQTGSRGSPRMNSSYVYNLTSPWVYHKLNLCGFGVSINFGTSYHSIFVILFSNDLFFDYLQIWHWYQSQLYIVFVAK